MGTFKRRDFSKTKHIHQSPSQFARALRRGAHKGRLIAIKVVAIVLAGSLIIGWLAYFFFYHSFFDVQKVIALNPGGARDSQIENIVKGLLVEKKWIFLKKGNINMLSSSEVKERTQKIVNLESVSVVKRWPSTIEVNFKRRLPEVILVKVPLGYSALPFASTDTIPLNPLLSQSALKEYYYLDDRGKVIEEIRGSTVPFGGAYPVLEWETDNALVVGRGTVESIIIEKVLHLDKSLLPAIRTPAEKFLFSDKLIGEIHVVTREGFRILINADADMRQQLQYLSAVLKEDIQDRRSNLEYIDLRIQGRVYYKEKER